MAGIADWARDVLISRGALVETEEGGALRALLPPELAGALTSNDWLSLRFGAGAGSDDEGDWLERLGKLLPPEARVICARLRHPGLAPAIDAGAVLERELAVQNGIFRLLEHYQGTARYYFFSFQYTIESDETKLGLWTGCLNASAHSLVYQTETLLDAVRDDLEEDPAVAVPRDELAQLFPMALRAAMAEIRRFAVSVEDNANRRLGRDTERIHAYYENLLRQIGKRISRHGGDPKAEEKERTRAAATQLDRAAKLEDLARKYALRIRIDPGDVLVLSLPVREISIRIMRKKAERIAKLHWNPILGLLDSPWCQACFGRAHPLFLCDDRLHCLCKSCFAPCPSCGKQSCRACKPRCGCGAAW